MATAPIINNPKSTGEDSPVDVSNSPQGNDKWVGSAITAAAAIASAIVGAVSQHRTNQAAQQRQEDAYRQNLLQWERENAYSSPLAQRRRLEAAGLNSALMYQNGTGSGAAAPSPQMSASVPVSPFAAANAQQAFQQAAMTSAEIANLNANTEKTQSETKNIDLNSGLTAVNIEISKFTRDKLQPEQLREVQSKIRNLDQSTINLNEMLLGITEDNVYKSLAIDKERFYQHFYMESDFASNIDLRKSTIFKNNTDALETLYLLHQKLLLMRANTFAQTASGGLMSAQTKTEEQNTKIARIQKMNSWYDFKFNRTLKSSPTYIKSIVDSYSLNNQKLRLDIRGQALENAAFTGKNYYNIGQGSNWEGFSPLSRQIETFKWSTNHMLHIVPGFGSAEF